MIMHVGPRIEGIRKLLLAVALDVSATEGDASEQSQQWSQEFVKRCRMGPTERGSLVLTIGCPLEDHPDTSGNGELQTTVHLMQTLQQIKTTSEQGNGEDLQLAVHFCEALWMLQPSDRTAHLTISVTRSRVVPDDSPREVTLTQREFELVQALATRLRSEL